MTSKLTFSELTETKSLEIKMTNILSFYEDIATSLAYQSGSNNVEVIAIEDAMQSDQITAHSEIEDVIIQKNVVKFAKPLQRSNDIVDYLIEREQLQSAQCSSNY